jgi:hypothetical protein
MKNQHNYWRSVGATLNVQHKTPIIESIDNIIRDFKVQIASEVLWRGVL